jgi:parallel beta-helix repeat protein
MFGVSPWYVFGKRIFQFALIAFCSAAASQAATVNIHPGDDIPSVVAANPAGTTYVIYPGTYRLQAHIVPHDGDKFIGQTVCAPPKSKCPAILSGSRVIGTLATFNGTNYEVRNQTQQGEVDQANNVCDPGFLACNLPEDLFFDGVPYQHLYATSLPLIGPKQWWFDYTNHIIYFHDNPAGHHVETSVLDTAFDSKANNVTIQYLTIVGFANSLQRSGLQATNLTAVPTFSTNWVVRNIESFHSHGAGLRIAYGMQVYDSYFHDNGTMGISGGTDSMTSSNVLIQGNTISRNNYAYVLPEYGAGGIKVGYTGGIVIRGNTVNDNFGYGIHFDDSSSNPLVDGNTVTGNIGGGGIAYEVSLNSATFRNNILMNNGRVYTVAASTAQIGSYASTGINAYCNVAEVPDITAGGGRGANGITIGASNRGSNKYFPFEYLMSTKNNFHHNTIIWAPNSHGMVGYFQFDAVHQPNFFADNPPPDHNEYHLTSASAKQFVYDNNNTQKNSGKTFAEYQAAGADIHGTADANNLSGFPAVAITYPPDQSSFTNSVTVDASASDKSGINRVEFYVDWNLRQTVTASPYSFDWTNATTGKHTVTAMAYSNAGIRNCYAVTLTKK